MWRHMDFTGAAPVAEQATAADLAAIQAQFALRDRIMNAPLSAEEKKIAEDTGKAFGGHTVVISGAVGAGLTMLVGLAFGSERYVRNASIGFLLGAGLGFAGQVAVVSQAVSRITAKRQAKYLAELHRTTPTGH